MIVYKQDRGRYILHSWLCLQVVGLVAYQVVSRNKILAMRLPRKCFHWLIEMVIDMIYTVWIITCNKSRREQCRNWILDNLCHDIYYHRIIYQRSWNWKTLIVNILYILEYSKWRKWKLLVLILSIIFCKKKTVENRYNKSYTDIKIIITYQPTCFMQAIYIIVQPIFQVSFIKHWICLLLNSFSSRYICNFSYFFPSLQRNAMQFYVCK